MAKNDNSAASGGLGAPPEAATRSLPGRRRWWTSLRARAAGGLGLLLLSPFALSFSSWRRPNLGVVDGRLIDCPRSPNCVCSHQWSPWQGLWAQGQNPRPYEHGVRPFQFADDPAAAWARLQQVLEQEPRCRIIERTSEYLRIEASTPVLRFVDDVEFLLVPAERVIHVRSASRVGYSDLGTNRKRVEALRVKFEGAAPPGPPG